MAEKKGTKTSAQLVVETLRNTLEQHFENINERLVQCNSLNSVDKGKALDKVEADVSGLLDTRLKQYRMNILSLPEKEEQEEQNTYKLFEEKRDSTLALIHKKRSELLGFNGHSAEKPEKTLNALSQVQEYGEDLQKKSKDALLHIKVTTEEDKKLAIEVEKKVKDNLDALLRIEDEREKMESTLKRVGKHLAYFRRTIASDKLLVCLIFTALVAIVGAVICYFAFNENKEQTE